MNESFDPYHNWLGIPPDEQPPHHYRLLGLQVFESNRDVISNAADRQMGHVRLFQSGKFAAQSQTLLNEIAAARLCLLSPLKKAAYDRQIEASGDLDHKPLKERPLPAPKPIYQDTPLSPFAEQAKSNSEQPLATPAKMNEPAPPDSSETMQSAAQALADSKPPIPPPQYDSGYTEQTLRGSDAIPPILTPPPPRVISESPWENQSSAPAMMPTNPYRTPGASSFQYGKTYAQPHRGSFILTLGLLGLIFSIPSLCPFMFVMIPVSLGCCISAWVMGKADLAAMARGKMDVNGMSITQSGYVMGILGVILSALGVVLFVLVLFIEFVD